VCTRFIAWPLRGIRAVSVAAQISDHYLRAAGELSSSAEEIHPGEGR
jgi:hypothetical protein